MNDTIAFIVMAFFLGLIWGMVFAQYFLKFQIRRGKLPKFLKEQKDSLIALIKEN